MQVIQTILDAPHQDLTVNLDGKDFLLSLRYSHRESRFYASIGSVEGVTYSTCKLVCNWKLFNLAARHNPLMPPGALLVLPGGPSDAPPTLEDFGPGRRCELVYVPASEVAALSQPLPGAV